MIAPAKAVTRWAEADIEFLRQNYALRGKAFVATGLNRSERQVGCMAYRLGLYVTEQRVRSCDWKPEEVSRLRELYPASGVEKTAELLGRTPAAVRGKASKLGLIAELAEVRRRQVAARRNRPKGTWSDDARAGRSEWLRLQYQSGLRRPSWIGRSHSALTRIKMSQSARKKKPERVGVPMSIESGRRKAASRQANSGLRSQQELRQLGQYLTTNAQRLIMEGNEKNGIAAGNEDVMQSSDGSWLLAELQKSFDTSVKHIVRMAAIVRRLDELGVAIEMESSVLPYLRKIAHGNLSPDLFVTMQGHKSMLNIASTLPAPVQQQIAKNEPIKVMSTNGDFRMVPPLSMTTKEVNQVFAFGRIRDEAEQVGYLRGKMQEKATTDHVCEEDAVKIDRKRRGIVVGKTFISFIELEHFYKALAPKKKSRQAV